MSDINKLNIFDRVTHKIVSDLEQGIRPWQKPWSSHPADSAFCRPSRHNGEPYRGVNILLLWDAALERGYQHPTWMTLKQAEAYGARVRKGERATWIVYANKVTKTEISGATGDKTEKQVHFLRGYSVFNAEQIDDLPEKFFLKNNANLVPLEQVDHFIRNTGATIRYGGDHAYYSEVNDYVQIPFLDQFKDRESYYATLAHEITHWTKHESRLNRDFGRFFWGDEGYAKEELVAEIGAAFLCADLGITPEIRQDHAGYLEPWLKALKDDRKLIFAAASHATRAISYLKSLQPTIDANAKLHGDVYLRGQARSLVKPPGLFL